MKVQRINMELPGPKAQALIARDARVVAPCYVRNYPFVMSHGSGAEVWDVDRNRFIDFVSGIAVCSTGHCHPEVVEAIRSAAGEFLHISSDYWHERQVQLGEFMDRIAPFGEPAMTFFCNSGTETVEGALKMARNITGRPRFIGFLGAFHGRTMGSLAFTSSKYTQQAGFFPAMPGVTHVPFPDPYRPLFAGADQGQAVLDYIEQLFRQNVPAKEVAAVLVEPIQGEGGYIVPPDGFLPGLRALCDRHGILMIADEVQSGAGRTGRWFASEHWGVRPDIITLAKGVGSGMPIGLIAGRRSLMEQLPPGSHGNTFGGNPICCAAALKTLELIEREYLANAGAMGQHLMRGLAALQTELPCIGDIRGRGLMIGIDLVTDRASRTAATDLCRALLHGAWRRGLLLLSCGASTMRLMPPLCVTQDLADEALQILGAALREAAGGKTGR
ncbi:MAG: acetyl ornithine aminotransferase family protein [Gammaproteobacteria bacterium]|nr:acetyl ornithine aminotransferase family protein [Gammaproteobacteria bacterium]